MSRLPTRILLAYALPALPLAALTLPVYALLPKHYASLGLSVAAIGWVLLLARLWDGISDPLIGWLSDRHHGRFGRRRPFILAGVPITLVALGFLFLPPEAVGPFYLAAWSFVLYLGWTLIYVPYAAWGAELSGDYHERTRIAAWRDVLFLLGTIAAPVLVFQTGTGAAGQEGEALVVLGLFVVVLLPAGVLALAAAVPEPSLSGGGKGRLTWRRGRVLLIRNAPFRKLILAFLLNGLANGLPAQLFLFYVQHVQQAGEAAGLLLLLYLLPGLLAVPLWLMLSRRFGKHVVWRWAMLWACFWFAVVPLLGPGDIVLFGAICVLTGAVLGADLVLPGAMQADVVDFDTARTGVARTGIYFALWGLASKLALALSALGLTAAAAFGFSDSADNTELALDALTVIYAGLPIVFKLIAVGLLWRWPLTEDVQAGLRRRIAERSVRTLATEATDAP